MEEAFCIARFRPELDRRVRSLGLTLFPMGAGIAWLALPEL